MREHLAAAAKQGSAEAEAQLREPELPPLAYLLDWFTRLSRSRGSNGFGPAPIGWLEIDAWSRVSGIRPTRFECEALCALDAEFFRARAK